MGKTNLFLSSVAGRHVAFTGSVAPWFMQRDLVKDLRKNKAEVQEQGGLNNRTSVLVRGVSLNWKHQKFGNKEAEAADRIRAGQNIIYGYVASLVQRIAAQAA